MAITVYAISGAPRSWRVLLGVTFRGLSFEIQQIEASKREQDSEAFRAINPRGTVPVLVADDMILTDSIAILAWLDRAYPDPPLFGADAAEAAAVWQQVGDYGDDLRAACTGLVGPLFFEEVETVTPALREAAQTMHREFASVEARLDRSDFLAGMRPTAADAVAYPEIRIVGRASDSHRGVMSELGFPASQPDYPAIGAWKRRVEALEGYDRTFPPHWR